ncbi:95c11c3a-75a2-4e76-b0d9-60b73cbb9c01 [Sclerotinia trifoliorum]|uniref:95c11c3a-75a2-4e76-b0d9-60b73cbb9c01 n=1 Tax=Sclerotinia trifoliorum TaxID=28548 RepID=A0A8H2VQC7_9HELO|nr:95c11c3a-75a2-4e76-b0d9-60b73cbb9c01 [Sclerotinia trifoliorum]
MVQISKIAFALSAACLAPVIAHPGEHHDHHAIEREIFARNIMASAAKRSLDSCSGSLKHRQLTARSVARRAEAARSLRAKRDIKTLPKKFRRDLATLEVYEAINHNETGVLDYSFDTPESTIFAANTSCILTPAVTDGPYYVVGESIRQDVTDGQPGVPLHLEVQYIDITTCKPVPNIYIDIWNANATGVYGGINITDNVADGGWNSTFLRGIQATDSDGVATFDTIFPGHYTGRATHTHLLAHTNVTVFPNNTIQGGAVTHIGQVFYNEVLRTAVEATYPYNTNTQPITSNANDTYSVIQAESDFDPFLEFMYLSDDITDGLLAWIQIGINTTADWSNDTYYSVAAKLQADGGHPGSTGNGFFDTGNPGAGYGTSSWNGTAASS